MEAADLEHHEENVKVDDVTAGEINDGEEPQNVDDDSTKEHEKSNGEIQKKQLVSRGDKDHSKVVVRSYFDKKENLLVRVYSDGTKRKVGIADPDEIKMRLGDKKDWMISSDERLKEIYDKLVLPYVVVLDRNNPRVANLSSQNSDDYEKMKKQKIVMTMPTVTATKGGNILDTFISYPVDERSVTLSGECSKRFHKKFPISAKELNAANNSESIIDKCIIFLAGLPIIDFAMKTPEMLPFIVDIKYPIVMNAFEIIKQYFIIFQILRTGYVDDTAPLALYNKKNEAFSSGLNPDHISASIKRYATELRPHIPGKGILSSKDNKNNDGNGNDAPNENEIEKKENEGSSAVKLSDDMLMIVEHKGCIWDRCKKLGYPEWFEVDFYSRAHEFINNADGSYEPFKAIPYDSNNPRHSIESLEEEMAYYALRKKADKIHKMEKYAYACHNPPDINKDGNEEINSNDDPKISSTDKNGPEMNESERIANFRVTIHIIRIYEKTIMRMLASVVKRNVWPRIRTPKNPDPNTTMIQDVSFTNDLQRVHQMIATCNKIVSPIRWYTIMKKPYKENETPKNKTRQRKPKKKTRKMKAMNGNENATDEMELKETPIQILREMIGFNMEV